MKEMLKTTRPSFVLLAALALAACASPDPDRFGAKVAAEGGATQQIGESWLEGEVMIAEGKELIEDGEDLVAKGKKKVRKGEGMVRDGERMMKEAEKAYQLKQAAPATS
jgi:hypothetical protein